MVSEVDICNAALIRIGSEAQITELGQAGREGAVCEILYPIARDSVLALHTWNFAIKRDTLTRDANAPEFEYLYKYLLPSDYIAAVDVYNSSSEWKEEDSRILSNDASISLKYIAKVTSTGKFSPLFVDVLITYLAMSLAKVISGSTASVDDLRSELNQKLVVAKRRDGQVGSPRKLKTDTSLTDYKW